MRKKKQLTACLCIAALTGVMFNSAIVSADTPTYEEEGVIVTEERPQEEQEVENEQAYYRTGGDVEVVDRKEIEERHYPDLITAIKNIPGVQVSGVGYHSLSHGSNYTDEVLINGDRNVVIMIDGVRLDNGVEGYGSYKTKTSIRMVTNIENVEKIEVLKGASASVYGADATGGVINIITRKGTLKPQTTLDVATGSWGKRNYTLTHSGSNKDGGIKYFFSMNRDQSNDTWYKDHELNKTVKFLNTHYKDNGVSIRIDNEFDKNHALSFSYSHTDSFAGHPLAAPQYSTLDNFFNYDGIGEAAYNDYWKLFAHRNWYLYHSTLNSYTKNQTNNYSVKYTFNKENGMESFIRYFENHNRYHLSSYGYWVYVGWLQIPNYGNFEDPLKNPGPYMDDFHDVTERTKGLEFQYAKKINRHNLITGWSYTNSWYRKYAKSPYMYYMLQGTDKNLPIYPTENTNELERNTLYGWLQDKIEVNDKWTVSPGIRYSYYQPIQRDYVNVTTETTKADPSTGNTVIEKIKDTVSEIHTEYPGASQVTFNLQATYKFDPSAEAYFSWAQVFRPLSTYDYTVQTVQEKLNNEKGDNWAIGINKAFSPRTSANINYSILDMSNAIARYSVAPEGSDVYGTRSINATQKKKALNLGMQHKFNQSWGINASYAYVDEVFHAKNWHVNPDPHTTVESMINANRAKNRYHIDLVYQNKKWLARLFTDIYSGMEDTYFTADRFVIHGLNVNYNVNKDTQLYFLVDNLTNQAYETRSGIASWTRPADRAGAYPQPGRSFTLGVKYNF